MQKVSRKIGKSESDFKDFCRSIKTPELFQDFQDMWPPCTRILPKAENSLLFKGLKFIPTPTIVNKALINKELEYFGRKLHLLWYFQNEKSITKSNPFRKKSTFNPKDKEVAIKLYFSGLKEEIISIDTRLSYSNLTKEERVALNSLRHNTSNVIKEADKGSCVVV